jgi:hypothetical protein
VSLCREDLERAVGSPAGVATWSGQDRRADARAGPISGSTVDAISFTAVLRALFAIRRARRGGSRRPGARRRASAQRLMSSASWPGSGLYRADVIDFLATFFAGSMLLLPIFANDLTGRARPRLARLA